MTVSISENVQIKKRKTRHSNGSGSFRKRKDGSIEYRVCYDLPNGEIFRKSFYGKTQSDCRDKKQEYDKQNAVPLDKIYTVSEWAVRWLALYKKDKCSINLYEQYKFIVENYIILNIGKLQLTAVKPAHIIEMMNKYKNMSKSHVRTMMTCVRGIFETAIDNDLCVKNPAKNINPEYKKPKEREFFNEKEIQIIEKFCFEERSNISDALLTLLYTGLRREELLGLQWGDIDFINEEINVNRCIVLEKGIKKIKGDLKNEFSKRVIPLFPQVNLILKNKPRTCEFVFPANGNDYQSPNGFSTTYHRLLKRINRLNNRENHIRELTPHCCRHTFATYLSARGVDIKIIQSILGHADISMTGNLYTHSTIDGIKKAVKDFKY